MSKEEKLSEVLAKLKDLVDCAREAKDEVEIDTKKYGREIYQLKDIYALACHLPQKLFVIEMLNAQSLKARYIDILGYLAVDKESFKVGFEKFKQTCKEAQDALQGHLDNWDKLVKMIEEEENE